MLRLAFILLVLSIVLANIWKITNFNIFKVLELANMASNVKIFDIVKTFSELLMLFKSLICIMIGIHAAFSCCVVFWLILVV